ncbi:FNBP1 [Cordylochernes scorpioides]|uniref:FNBP1 n=1 Tax=Cordylochernes scorpioides TaxID=51811 RepID=A0ABY6KQM3_9ARAC|nr:FNBP1 [Cordylochernes scorpioides]
MLWPPMAGVPAVLPECKRVCVQHLQNGAKLHAALQVALTQLEKSKKNYEKAFKEAEKAQENFQKADADLNLSRAEVEKARVMAATKTQVSEEFKTEYYTQLQKTNTLQRQHFTEFMPQVFQELQQMDERRTIYLQDLIRQVATDQREVLPIITSCLDGITSAADNTINPTADSMLESSQVQVPTSNKRDTLKGTINSGKPKKRGGLFGIFGSNKVHLVFPTCPVRKVVASQGHPMFVQLTRGRSLAERGKAGGEGKEDYSDLPPNQRRKKLQHKITDLAGQIQQETATRDGLLKMKGVYEQNPALGDPLTVEGQLVENASKLDNLNLQLAKFQNYLKEAEGGAKTRSSISEESISSESTDPGRQPPPLPLGRPDPGTDDEFDSNGRDFDPEPLPVLGTARALYPFEGQSEGSVPMKEGDEFEVVELDQGDGWTRIRRPNMEEGFVPTSYIECFLYTDG